MEPSMFNTQYPMYVVSRYGYTLESTPTLDSLIVGEWSIWPDFILIKREDIPVLQGMAAISGLDVSIIELLDSPNPDVALYLDNRILLTHSYPSDRLASLIRRVPSPQYDVTYSNTLYLISVE